jgi:hypothetical protein
VKYHEGVPAIEIEFHLAKESRARTQLECLVLKGALNFNDFFSGMDFAAENRSKKKQEVRTSRV